MTAAIRRTPPTMPDRARGHAANPDVICIASYPPDLVGLIRAANEIGVKPRMFGGAMIGLGFTPIKAQLGPLLNGIVNYDTYVPEPTMKFPGVDAFLKTYQEKAPAAGVDPPAFPAAVCLCADAGAGAGGDRGRRLDQAKLAEHCARTFNTIVGEVKFGANGEWQKNRTLTVQFQGVQAGDVNQFKQAGKAAILHPTSRSPGP